MASYKWKLFYDQRERLCYQVEGKGATVVTLSEGRYLILAEKAKDVIFGSRDDALKAVIDLLEKKPAVAEG